MFADVAERSPAFHEACAGAKCWAVSNSVARMCWMQPITRGALQIDSKRAHALDISPASGT
jgi:hypothetical protein